VIASPNARSLAALQATLSPVLDIVDQRVHDAHTPEWCEKRGWSEFLLGLSASELSQCETHGLAVALPTLRPAPESLSDLAARVRTVSALPMVETALARPTRQDLRGVNARKQQQLATLLGALAPLAARARRIVDVGSGSGHFARLSARHFDRETLGLERNPERVAHARSRALEGSDERARARAEFAVVDAVRATLRLNSDDLAIGLHACGELGDTLVQAVADSGADLALISCCLQKIGRPERPALSRAASGFALRQDTLGLSNLTSQANGVETSVEQNILGRQARYALRLLLRARGLEFEPGAEMQGVNRRQAQAGLAAIARRSLELHGLAPARDAEIREIEEEATRQFNVIRRLSLPRDMLARPIELSVIFDRAARLEESGHAVCVAALFARAVSPRNVALFASRDGARLPAVVGLAELR